MTVREIISEHATLLDDSIVKVDAVLNHQVLPHFIEQVAKEFKNSLERDNIGPIGKLLTIEASGIAPTIALAQLLSVPMVYARRGRRITMSEPVYTESVPSRTSNQVSQIVVSGENLSNNDQVLIVDDFLGSGAAADAAARIVSKSGAKLLGFAFVVEKEFESGRSVLSKYDKPIISLTKVDIANRQLKFR